MIFLTIFHKDVKNVKIFRIGQCPSTLKLCLACLLSFVEQASLAELECRGGLSDQKFKKGTFVRVEKLSFWQLPVKIHDVAGTPNRGYCNRISSPECMYSVNTYNVKYLDNTKKLFQLKTKSISFVGHLYFKTIILACKLTIV